MAILRRPLLISGAFHAVIAALFILVATPPPPTRAPANAQADVALIAIPLPPSLVVVETAAGGGSAGWAGDSQPRAATPAPARRARLPRVVSIAAAIVAAPEIVDAVPVPAEATETPPIAPAAAAVDDVPAADIAAAPFGAPEGSGAAEGGGGKGGDGAGDGSGDGFGAGTSGKSARGALHARVLGNIMIEVRAPDGVPVVSHDEATALRERDAFPRLDERLWPAWQPYVVTLEICVGGDGSVTDVVLRSSVSARLDPIVLAAVKTWRYRPRVVAGQPAPFCHGVVIKYERW